MGGGLKCVVGEEGEGLEDEWVWGEGVVVMGGEGGNGEVESEEGNGYE